MIYVLCMNFSIEIKGNEGIDFLACRLIVKRKKKLNCGAIGNVVMLSLSCRL